MALYGLEAAKVTKLCIHSVTAKTAWKFGTEVWAPKERDEQRLETAQMKFLRHLLGFTKLDGEINQFVREELDVQKIVQKIQQYKQK
jgi:hypothetical protein